MELPKARESKAAIAAAMKASFATEHQKREIRGGLEADMKEFKKEIVRMVRRSRSGNHRTDFNDVKRNNNRKSFIQKIFFFSRRYMQASSYRPADWYYSAPCCLVDMLYRSSASKLDHSVLACNVLAS